MKQQIRVIRENGVESRIERIDRDDWDGVDDPCPNCGTREFNHYTASGGHFGQQGTNIVERTDFWNSERKLFTQCRHCDEVLYKHPAFDLLFEPAESSR